MRDFNTWLSGFRDSIADYGYYVDFEKVHRNIDSIKVELNILIRYVWSAKVIKILWICKFLGIKINICE